MLSWLRRMLGRRDRRWIRDPNERDRHDSHVRERLRGEITDDPVPSPAEPDGEASAHRADDAPVEEHGRAS